MLFEYIYDLYNKIELRQNVLRTSWKSLEERHWWICWGDRLQESQYVRIFGTYRLARSPAEEDDLQELERSGQAGDWTNQEVVRARSLERSVIKASPARDLRPPACGGATQDPRLGRICWAIKPVWDPGEVPGPALYFSFPRAAQGPPGPW